MEYAKQIGERCQICQVPLSALTDLGENLQLHNQECFQWHEKNKKKAQRKCCKGINCTSSLPGHYINFSHDVLAQHLKLMKLKSPRKSPKKRVITRSATFESPLSKMRKPDSTKNSPNKLKSPSTSQSNSKSGTIDSFFSVDKSSELLEESEKPVTQYPWQEEVHEIENIICDVDANYWNKNVFDDEEDTIPLECIHSDTSSDIFKDSPDENVKESCNNQKLEPKVTEVQDELDIVDISEGEEVFEEKRSSPEKWNFLMKKTPKKEVKEAKISPIIKTRLFSMQNAPVESFAPKKQVSITSYFGSNISKSKVPIKFVEEKVVAEIKPRSKSATFADKPTNDNEVTSTTSNESSWKRQRYCPFYKKIPGTTFTVDAFNYGNIPGINHYFLSHFHYDHYQGLTKKFQGKIYCNSITGKLITLKIGIPFDKLNILPMVESSIVDGVEIKLLDANHCPGSIMFLFRLPNGHNILHTGDFRAHTKMQSYPDIMKSKIDVLYLDTTYLNPTYTFPLQEDIVNFVVSLAKDNFRSNPKTLFVCGSYTIGKERVFIAIAEKLNLNVWASREKLRIFGCIENEILSKRLTQNPNVAQIHVLPMNQLNFKSLQVHLTNFKGTFNNILAIKPTGWEYRAGSSSSTLGNIKPKISGAVSVYGIPYSEHSSYDELKTFVQFLRPKKIIPTVNVGNPTKRNEMNNIMNSWMR